MLLLVAGQTARAGSAVPEWTRLSLGLETGAFMDGDPLLYHGADSWTRSLYMSRGRLGSYHLLLGLNDQHVNQEYWDHRVIRRMAVLEWKAGSRFVLELAGFQTSGSADVDGNGLRLGVSGTFASAGAAWESGLRLGRQRPALDTGGAALPVFEKVDLWTGELRLMQRRVALRRSLALLYSRRADRGSLALLLRLGGGGLTGISWRLSLLAGRQENWFDQQQLVLHDNPRPLKSLLEGGLAWHTGGGWGAELTLGWERSEGHENRWAFLGFSWTWRRWLLG